MPCVVDNQADIVVVGGGPVGAVLGLRLRGSTHKFRLVEAREDPQSASDARILALSHGSALILRRCGIWDELEPATPISSIHVSQKQHFGRAQLTAEDAKLPALGYVTTYASLYRALHRKIRAAGVDCLYGARVTKIDADPGQATAYYICQGAGRQLRAKLLVIADGGAGIEGLELEEQRRDYHQFAVTAVVKTAAAHENTAYERFTPDGPIALLPFKDACAVIWTADPANAQRLCGLGDAEFLAGLQRHFGDRLGAFVEAGPRAKFPLALRRARPAFGQRAVLLGNAAQTLHPVAGQGFNLGLRDAWELGACAVACPAGELGSPAMLKRYQRGRMADRKAGVAVTDALARLFSNDFPLLRESRGLALTVFDVLPPAKRVFSRKMIFGAHR